MQNAKDTFYITLRNRLATVNPQRVMQLKGVIRPGILVEDAEAPAAQMPADVFVLRWAAAKWNASLPLPLAQLDCEIRYTTGGTQANGGLDRGRAMTAMDAELTQLLRPACAPKMDYSQTPAAAKSTQVFWTTAALGPVATIRDRLERAAKVTVFAYQEQGEQ